MKLGRILLVYLAIALTGTAGLSSPSLADAVYKSFLGNAINGYDPVAYFKQGKPVEGSSDHQLTWNDATWKFASAENKADFEKDPEKYAPQFGGFCAWAVSQGYTASTVPEAWDIVDGKLYLNYSLGVQSQWRQNRATNITAAEGNWPGLRDK